MAETRNTIHLWRHPRPRGAEGRCIGRTDLSVDDRKAKRLAHRIRQAARRERLERVIWTSPLQRSADVGRWLQRWGWQHRIDPRLIEIDFGCWDGQRWSEIDPAQISVWADNFLHHGPGGGESLDQLRHRVREVLADPAAPSLIVGHAGWINALRTLALPAPRASDWPAPPRYGQSQRFSLETPTCP